jgi:hypothetical protein
MAQGEEEMPYRNKRCSSNDATWLINGGNVMWHKVSPCQQASADAVGDQGRDSQVHSEYGC